MAQGTELQAAMCEDWGSGDRALRSPSIPNCQVFCARRTSGRDLSVKVFTVWVPGPVAALCGAHASVIQLKDEPQLRTSLNQDWVGTSALTHVFRGECDYM